MGRRDGACFRPHACRSVCWRGRQGRRHKLPLFRIDGLPCLAPTASAHAAHLSKPSSAARNRVSDRLSCSVQSAPLIGSSCAAVLSDQDQHLHPPSRAAVRTQLRVTTALSGRLSASNTCPRPITARCAEPVRGPLNERFPAFHRV